VNTTPEWTRGLAVEVGGTGIVSHVGAVALRLLATKVGLTSELSTALRRKGSMPTHDRGQVVTDLAVMIADGGEAISDIAILGDQKELLGPVASMPTAWRTLDEITPARLKKIASARAKTRRHVWTLIKARHGRIPPARIAGGDLGATVVIRLDATVQTVHSEKQHATPTYKHTFGFHPLTAWCDNTRESLAFLLRPGNAGANTVADHLTVLGAAITQIPAEHRRDLLITCDGAGATLDLVRHITTLNDRRGFQVHYSIGFDLDARARTAIGLMPEQGWQAVLDPDGQARDLDKAGVAELTGLLRHSTGGDQLPNWPTDMRVVVRREKPHPGAQLSLFEQLDGWRYQLLATNTPTGQIAFLEARHRTQARVEDRIRCGKDTGLGRLPSRDFAINQAWCAAATIACDLLTWLQLLTLHGELAHIEPKTLRYRLLHTAARLVRGGRKRTLKIPTTWPWATHLAAAITTILALPPP
jgi:hypothetical protein